MKIVVPQCPAAYIKLQSESKKNLGFGCLSDPKVSKQGPCCQGTEFKNHQSQEHSDHVFDSVEDPIYDKMLFSFARQP